MRKSTVENHHIRLVSMSIHQLCLTSCLPINLSTLKINLENYKRWSHRANFFNCPSVDGKAQSYLCQRSPPINWFVILIRKPSPCGRMLSNYPRQHWAHVMPTNVQPYKSMHVRNIFTQQQRIWQTNSKANQFLVRFQTNYHSKLR